LAEDRKRILDLSVCISESAECCREKSALLSFLKLGFNGKSKYLPSQNACNQMASVKEKEIKPMAIEATLTEANGAMFFERGEAHVRQCVGFRMGKDLMVEGYSIDESG
jgi:hypothetical protein